MKDKLSFYDVKSKSKFESNEYDVREKKGRYFAVKNIKFDTTKPRL